MSIAQEALRKAADVLAMLWLLTALSAGAAAQVKIAQLKYEGGGDWYGNTTALPNLIAFCNQQLGSDMEASVDNVAVGDRALFLYPYVYMTGHGSVSFNDKETRNLRQYLIGGGFLHIDDNYGMDAYVHSEMQKVFPELKWIELPFDHPIYHEKFDFPQGLPKIHEHDGKPPQGLGLIYKGRLVVFYSYECDLGNGWEDVGTYNDPAYKHTQALQMGANIIAYCLTRYR